MVNENRYRSFSAIPVDQRTPTITTSQNAPPKFSAITVEDLGSPISFDELVNRLETTEGKNLSSYDISTSVKMYDAGLRRDTLSLPHLSIPLPFGHDFLADHAQNLRQVSKTYDRAQHALLAGKLSPYLDSFTYLPPFHLRWLRAVVDNGWPHALDEFTLKRFDAVPNGSLRIIEQNRICLEGIQYTQVRNMFGNYFAEKYLGLSGSNIDFHRATYEWLKNHYKNHPRTLSNHLDRPIRIAISIENEFDGTSRRSEVIDVARIFNIFAANDPECSGAIIAQPTEFSLDKGQMYVVQHQRKIPIDLLWVNSYELFSEELDRQGNYKNAVDDYWEILENPNRYPLTIDGASRIGANKSLQSALMWLPWWQEELALTSHEMALLKRYTPFTIDPLISPNIIVNNEKISTTMFIKAFREHLVVKPAIGTHGGGFKAGLDCSERQWKEIIDEAYLTGNRIFQFREPYPTIEMPTISAAGNICWQEFCLDLGIQCLGASSTSASWRASPKSRFDKSLLTMNISEGGGYLSGIALPSKV